MAWQLLLGYRAYIHVKYHTLKKELLIPYSIPASSMQGILHNTPWDSNLSDFPICPLRKSHVKLYCEEILCSLTPTQRKEKPFCIESGHQP